MSISHSHSLKRGVAVVAAAFSLLAVATPSYAVTTSPGAIIGSFDPPFGLSIPNLGFKGTFNLTVLGCNPGAGGGYVFNGGNCSITMNSLTLNFYNSTANPNGSADPAVGGGYLRTYTLGYPGSTYPTAFAAGYVQGAFYDANDQFVGFDTEDSNTFNVSVFDSSNGRPTITYNGDMLLYFLSGHKPVLAGAQQSIEEEAVDPAFLVDCNQRIPGAAASSCNRNSYVNSNGAIVTINGNAAPAAVPEPETGFLALIGFAALIANRLGRRPRLNRTPPSRSPARIE